MYTNADCTLYLYRKDGKQESYTRFPVEGVYWEDVRQSSFLKTGQRDAVSTLLVIPMESLKEPVRFTAGRDLVVKGLMEDEIMSGSQEALSKSLLAFQSAYDVQTIISVDERLYGSERVQHYELSCR